MNMRAYFSEFLGTTILLFTIIGSGIMGETLADGNTAIALLGNTIATGAILFVLITIFGPISGAHFNPAVSIAMLISKKMTKIDAVIYIILQIIGAVLGVLIAHLMFELQIFQISLKLRQGPSQGFSEIVATFGLIIVIFGGLKVRPDAVPALVGFYITSAYWFTASTSFANPAVTLARSLSNTFAGINPSNIGMFIFCQFVGMLIAIIVVKYIFSSKQ
ncbi:aquaporin family protein [Amylibacter sp.]|nr:aquaporin family protein [Amylibacter sp.]MDA9300302.1 aquaporin family protein [Amylibacter sp.]MDB2337072.1 aquaporin family protein [Amylibacter sp.]MDB2472589.1 aquaporin family protein [Amylibacter sp.]MDB4087721.1 aquaporin family protein [Amylibacter sp.]